MTFCLSFLREYYKVPGVIIPVYLLRCGFQWSTGSLSYSIIADYVPKAYRARWNTLESIASFGWSGSAVLGGKLVKMSGYSLTFAITASIQLLSIIVFALPIVPLVAKESDIQDLVETQLERDDTRRELEEPLLGSMEASDEGATKEVVSQNASIYPTPTSSKGIIKALLDETMLQNEDISSSLSKSLDTFVKVGSLR